MDSRLAVKQLKRMRKMLDKEGAGRLAAEGWDEDWKCLIAIILSAQSRDTKTIEVSEKLFKKYSSPKRLGLAPLIDLEKMIREINYHKTKARHIKKTASMIAEIGIKYKLEELMKFPGVGRKTANVFLVETKGAAAIGVDTHVARLSQKLGWTKNKVPAKIEKDLEKLFPRKYWNSINYTLVGFGQTFGRSRRKEDELLKEIFILIPRTR